MAAPREDVRHERLCRLGCVRLAHEDMKPVTSWVDDMHLGDRLSQATGLSQTVARAADEIQSYKIRRPVIKMANMGNRVGAGVLLTPSVVATLVFG